MNGIGEFGIEMSVGEWLPSDFDIHSIRVEFISGGAMMPNEESHDSIFTLTAKGNSRLIKRYVLDNPDTGRSYRYSLPEADVKELFGRIRDTMMCPAYVIMDGGSAKITFRSSSGRTKTTGEMHCDCPDWFVPLKEEIERMLEKAGYGKIDIAEWDTGDGSYDKDKWK